MVPSRQDTLSRLLEEAGLAVAEAQANMKR